MKTDDLIARLSVDSKGSGLAKPTPTILSAVAISCLVMILMASGWLGLQTELGSAFLFGNRDFLLNFVFIISVGTVAMAIVRDLSVPGRSLRIPLVAIVIPFVLLGGSAMHELGTASSNDISHHADWASLFICVWKTSMLALPALSLLAIGVRRLAPTDLRRTGFCLGLLAGAIGSMGYCLHAPNESVTFGIIAYSANILFMAIIGGLAGPRLLRWR